MKAIYVKTLYSLLLALMIIEDDLDKIMVFYNYNTNPNYKKYFQKFKNSIELSEVYGKNRVFCYFKNYIVNNKLLKIIKRNDIKKIYMQDQLLLYGQFFLNNISNCYVVEDGTANYSLELINKTNEEIISKYSKRKYNNIFRFKLKVIDKIKKVYNVFGIGEKVEKIYLTGVLPVPDIISDKVEIINIKEKWDNLENNKKDKILEIFNISLVLIEELKRTENAILILTQPLSEDGILTEKEKIQIYKEIILNNNKAKIYIKSHPREKTDYKKILEKLNLQIEIIRADFPIELLLFFNIRFKKVITLFSTAALNFKANSDIEFLGTKNYPKLLKKFGDISI